MDAPLAPIFVDAARVRLQGDPQPTVAKIVTAAGMSPSAVQVYRLGGADDPFGTPVAMQDVIDRTAPGESAVYLRCQAKNPPGTRPARNRAAQSEPAEPAPMPSAPSSIGSGEEPREPSAPAPASPPQGAANWPVPPSLKPPSPPPPNPALPPEPASTD